MSALSSGHEAEIIMPNVRNAPLKMESMFPKVLQAIPGDGYKVFAYMNDGTVRCVDVQPLIDKGGAFTPLKDRALFCGKLTILNDTVAWDISGKHDPSDCIDIDPFTIHALPIAAGVQ